LTTVQANGYDWPVTVVVGYVSRPEGRAALEVAVEEARRTGERLVVVGVAAGSPAVSSALDDGLAAVEERLAAEPFAGEVRRGSGRRVPGDELLHAVSETHARLLVIGMRPRPVHGRLLPGVTAQQLVLEAPCDVLTVRAPAGRSEGGSRRSPGP
jgi:nucleotide-binding universal stress UspA family protein